MTHFGRFVLSASLTVMVAGAGVAQTTSSASQVASEKTIQSWLVSGDPLREAWGAHDAMVAHDERLIPELLSLASQWQPLSRQVVDESHPEELSPRQKDQRDATAAVLDALIQMKGSVPADTLRNLAPDFGNDVAVLLSRMPSGEVEPLAFDLYHLPTPHTGGLQYVSAAILALHPVPGFAADMLANIDVKARVYAVLPGSGPFGGGTSGSCGLAPDGSRKGWPMTGQYALSRQESNGAILLVAGIDPVYATRQESMRYRGDDCGFSWGVGLGSGERLRLIAEMLGIAPETIPWKTDIQTSIEFQSIDQFDRDLLAFAAGEQHMYRSTVSALASRGLLTSAEAQAEILPKLMLRLEDMRGQGAAPIPEPENLPSRVEWTPSPF